MSYNSDNIGKRFTSHNSPIQGFVEPRNTSRHSEGSIEDDELNNDLESRDHSDCSHDATKKNIFMQENIINPEDGIVTLEEVREYEEESNSIDSGRQQSNNPLNE